MTLTILDPRTGERVAIVVTAKPDGKRVWKRTTA